MSHSPTFMLTLTQITRPLKSNLIRVAERPKQPLLPSAGFKIF